VPKINTYKTGQSRIDVAEKLAIPICTQEQGLCEECGLDVTFAAQRTGFVLATVHSELQENGPGFQELLCELVEQS
jgi:hypothetical protein